VNRNALRPAIIPEARTFPEVEIINQTHYDTWRQSNVFAQKQDGFFGVYIKVLTGDIPTSKARQLVAAIRPYVADEIKITINQGLLLQYVREAALPALFVALDNLGYAIPGFNSVADVTTCPGTDTCNLGISNSTEMARELENLIYDEYEDLILNQDIKIKISGCMNSCGQHGLAQIGFHGSSLKAGAKVIPAAQVLIGGGTFGNGVGRAADKVIKVPSKRVKDVLRRVLNDYSSNQQPGETFNAYYDRFGKDHYYQLLKPLADLNNLTDDEFVDWGHQETFQTAIGVGECAGVVIDLVATLLYEADEKQGWATRAFEGKAYADAIYHAYSVFISGAKALLLDKGINSSTQTGIIKEFDLHYVTAQEIEMDGTFNDIVLQINRNEPSAEFAASYLAEAREFLNKVKVKREALVKL
jgi:sulfite reductase (ferredoxin)